MKRVVVTGGRSPLARCVVAALRASPDVEVVCAVEPAPRREAAEEDLDFVSFVPDHRPFVEYLDKERIDTVVQCGLVPDRSGLGSRVREADVIGTMCLGAAIAQERSSVRSWVLTSSTAIYPIGSEEPLLHHERQSLPREEETPAASIAEAEEYARDVAYRLPHVNVAILRLQQLVGGGVRGPLAALLARDPVPSPIGYDPAIQLLHLDDAASAIVFAARQELAGVYNVASEGLIHWQDAVRAAGHASLPVLPVGVALLEPLLERIGIPFVPAELLDLLRFGHVVDIRKLEQAGWRPRYDQPGCLRALQGV
jgi:UDP-glucose 4-epimerase